MKKTTVIIASSLLIGALVMGGCTSAAPASSSTASAAAASSGPATSGASSETSAAITPVVTTNTDNLYSEKNDYVFRSVFQTVSLDEASAKAYPALNDALKAFADKALKDQQEKVESIKNDPDVEKEIKNSGTYLYDDSSIMFYRTDEEVFSFISVETSFLGGPHPNTVITTAAFDPKTGKEIALTDVVKSKKELLDKVKEKLKKDYPDVEFTDLDKSMKDLEEEKDIKLKWTISGHGLVIFFNAYDLAPHAYGSQAVAFLYDDSKDLFTGKYKNIDGSFVFPMSAGGESEADVEGTGKPASIFVKGTYDEPNEHYTGITVKYNDKTCELKDNVFIDYYVKGIHTKDNRNYIYVFTTGYSDVPEILVFEIKDGNVTYNGSVGVAEKGRYIKDDIVNISTPLCKSEAKFVYETYPITNPDKLVFQERVDAMSTYYIARPYKINDKGIPEATEEFGEATSDITLTLKTDIQAKSVDIAKNELKDDVSLKKGDKITIYRTNGKDTVIFKTSDGSYVGLKYEKSFEFNGKPTEETFDGAVFAG